MAPKPNKMLSNVLVVCHGNICRSPLAAAVLAKIIGASRVRSCGFVNPGRRAAKKIREYAANNGYDLEASRSRQITADDVEWADRIVFMDQGNLRRLSTEFPNHVSKATCLASYVQQSRIPDPNYLPRGDALDSVLAMLLRAASFLGNELCQQESPR